MTRIGPGSIWLGDEEIEADTVLWAAGVSASPIAKTIGVPLDGGGRVIVEPDLTIPGHPNVFAIGDVAAAKDEAGEPLPGTAPVAIQAAESTVENIQRLLAGQSSTPFTYRDRG